MPTSTAEPTTGVHSIPVDENNHYTFPPKTYNDRKRNVAQILWCLHYDGPFEDPTGGTCAAMLNEALARRRVVISSAVLNVILRDLDHRGAKYGHMIERKCPPRGKRTYRIALLRDPGKVPFPPNPWPHEAKAGFEPKSGAKPLVDLDEGEDDDHTELEETFTRHRRRTRAGSGTGIDVMARLYQADADIKAREAGPVEDVGHRDDPRPATGDEEEAPVDIDAAVAAVQQILDEIPAAADPEPDAQLEEPVEQQDLAPSNGLVPVGRTPTITLDEFDVDDPLSTDLDPKPAAGGYAAHLTQAIEHITNAITMRAAEEANRHEDVGLLVDQRMAAYIRLNDENADLRRKLDRSLKREGELIALARQLKATINQMRSAQ